MKKLFALSLLISFFLVSCGGGDNGDDPPTPTIPDPSATTLIFPENNTECHEGEIISDTQSRVTFQWNASQNTDSYELNVVNLNTNGTQKATSNTTEASVNIERGTPFEWYVISKANGTNVTATSSTFRFYNQGPGVENHTPFPAEAVAPNRGETVASTTNLDLIWDATDLDNDIADYEVFFGTEIDPTNSIGVFTINSTNVDVISGNVYYWKVITQDAASNTSTSPVFEFRVN